MRVIAQRAIYGDTNGAHALIEPKASTLHLLGKITRFTDRPGHLPPHVSWRLYFSGYPFEDHYVLSITFPDPTASRAGMVLTHALVFKLEDAIQMPDLMPALLALPAEHQKSTNDNLVHIVVPDEIPHDHAPPGLINVVHHLLDESRGERPVVWVGQEGFAEIVSAVWQGLWPGARKIYRFRLSFTPQDVEGQELTIVAIPQGVENRWEAYPLVRPSDIADSQTKAEAFLLRRPEGEPLRVLLAELGTEPRSMPDLKKLEACHDYLKQLSTGAADISADGVRMLVRLLGVLSPDADSGVALKSEALDMLLKLTNRGTAADVQALRNLNAEPFRGGSDKINRVVTSWMQRHLLVTEPSVSGQSAGLIQASFELAATPWGKSVQAALRGILFDWQGGVARAVWQWWRKTPRLIEDLESFIPNLQRVEADLAEHCPRELPEDIGELVRSLAQKKDWFVLHATAVSAYLQPDDALRKQLQIEKDENHIEGLRALAERVPSVSLLEVALETGNRRLLKLAGEACARVPSLITPLDVGRAEWRTIWLHAIETGAPTMAGINSPREVIDELITLLSSGTTIERKLLLRVAGTSYADLTLHPQRGEAWRHMDERARELFLNATADGWLQRFRVDSSFDRAVERELEEAVLDRSRIIKHIASAGVNGVSFLVNLFKRFTRLTSHQFKELLDAALSLGQPVNGFDVVLVGRLVRERGWRDCARHLAWYLETRNRRDLAPAVQECQSLLSLFDSFRLRWTGKLSGVRITEDDW